MGGDQLQPGEEDGGTPTEDDTYRSCGRKNKKILKNRKQENKKIPPQQDGRGALGAGYPITTPHSRNPLAGVGGDQLQPGEEDGGWDTYRSCGKKTRKSKKRRW